MKVLGIMGSPRVGGNSDVLLSQALEGAKAAGADVKKIILARKEIAGCRDCKKCNKTGTLWMTAPASTAFPFISGR